jgi:hypothetical protein
MIPVDSALPACVAPAGLTAGSAAAGSMDGLLRRADALQRRVDEPGTAHRATPAATRHDTLRRRYQCG